MNIYTILSSKPHNPHYLNRYIKFIESFSFQHSIKSVTEEHHICPKSKDLFPEYISFKNFPWNKINLTKRQHFIAHYLLSNAYRGKQIYAFWAMVNKQSPSGDRVRDYKVTSRTYETAKNNFISVASNRSLDKVNCWDSSGNRKIVSKEEYKNNPELVSNMKGRTSIKNIHTKEFKVIFKSDYDKNYDKLIWVSKLCKGLYHTPIGSFNNSHQVNAKMCIENDKVITRNAVSGSMANKKTKWLTVDMIGKTYKEVGFSFEPLGW